MLRRAAAPPEGRGQTRAITAANALLDRLQDEVLDAIRPEGDGDLTRLVETLETAPEVALVRAAGGLAPARWGSAGRAGR